MKTTAEKAVRGIDRGVAALAVLLIRVYRLALSPLLHTVLGPSGGCRHAPSCSRYAHDCFRLHPVPRALFLSVRRVLRCNPFFEGGYDPVPRPRAGAADAAPPRGRAETRRSDHAHVRL